MGANGSESEISDDHILLGFIAIVAIGGGLIPIAAMLEPVKAWLLKYHVLVEGPGMLLEIPGTGAGLDLLRIVGLAAALILLIALVALAVHRRRIRSQQQR